MERVKFILNLDAKFFSYIVISDSRIIDEIK